MTVICALYAQNEIHLGCNSQGTVGATRLPNHQSKWQFFGDWAIALTGSGFPSDVLESERKEFPSTSENILEVTSFIRSIFNDYEIGDAKKMKNFDSQGLLVHKSGKIYDMDGYTSVSMIPENTLWARGCGMDYALGADEVSKKHGASPKERVEAAVEASIELDCDCPGKVILERHG